MNEWNFLKEVLELSVKKNGVINLTNQHLLNILKMVDRRMVSHDIYMDAVEDRQNAYYDNGCNTE